MDEITNELTNAFETHDAIKGLKKKMIADEERRAKEAEEEEEEEDSDEEEEGDRTYFSRGTSRKLAKFMDTNDELLEEVDEAAEEGEGDVNKLKYLI
jgi:hypothetical protein